MPGPWLVTPISSVHDLDNIRFNAFKDPSDGVHAIYELKHILVEGHCLDSTEMSPPRGLQVQLGTQVVKNQTDTIVMANYGYLQLQANPGIWTLYIRPGSSFNIYQIYSAGRTMFDYNPKDSQSSNPRLTISSFRGATTYILVQKRVGKESESLLAGEDGDVSRSKSQRESSGSGLSGLWNKIKSAIPFQQSNSVVNTNRINIFAVASGHLYERLMSIMILSVLNNTQSNVKFWLIENFLSPSFKDFIPRMAEHYNFEVELVTYKWPHWLNSETEKQRTIWGYKDTIP